MDDKEECSICLEDMIQRRKSSSSSDVPNYPNNSNIPECVDLECGHAFHKACLAKWASPYYEDNPTCPVCRTRMTKADIALSCGICRSRAIDVNVAFHNVDERTTIRHDANTEFPYYSQGCTKVPGSSKLQKNREFSKGWYLPKNTEIVEIH